MKAEAAIAGAEDKYFESAVHDLIEAQVERAPDAVALVSGGIRLSYRDLNNRANVLAAVLRNRGWRQSPSWPSWWTLPSNPSSAYWQS